MTKPVVSLTGVDDNPFRLLIRVRRALRESGLRQDVPMFDHLANSERVVGQPTSSLSSTAYAVVVTAAERFVTLREGAQT